MEGGGVFESMDSLWFYASVFLRASSSKHKQINGAEELQLQARQQQDSAETHRTSGGGAGPGQAPRCVKEAAAQTERRAPAAGTVRVVAATATTRGCREWDDRMVAWQKEQRRRTAARCSQAPMPATGGGVAMKAHLRSWAHAVACSVR